MKTLKDMILESVLNESFELVVTFYNEKDAQEYADSFKGDREGKVVHFPVRTLKKATELANTFPKHKVKKVQLPD